MTHQWNFFRAGGFDQVQLKTGEDLLALGELNQKLWVALSCPTRGIEFDTRTLDMIDSDRDAQVHANEVKKPDVKKPARRAPAKKKDA